MNKKVNVTMAITVIIIIIGVAGVFIWLNESSQSQSTDMRQQPIAPTVDHSVNKLISLGDFGGPYYGYYKDNNGIYVYSPLGMCAPNCPEEEKQYPDYYLKNGMCDLTSSMCPFQKIEADLNSFEVIGIVKGLNDGSNLFAKDKNYVYRYGQKIEDVNGQNFEFLYNSAKVPLYAKDINSVYILYNDELGGKGSLENFEKLPSADPDSFQFFEHKNCQSTLALYSKDKNKAYFGHLPIENSNGLTFQHVALSVAKDKNRVYFLGKEVKNADPTTIQYIPDNDNSCNTTYFKDKNNVYNCFNKCEILKNINPNTFDPNKK